MPLIATRGAASAQGFGEFAQSGPVNYIEDVFSTYLYTGNGSTQTITNNIDLSTKGGLVWIKGRSNTQYHNLIDTDRGATKVLESDDPAAQFTQTNGLTTFSSSGFSIGNDSVINFNSYTYVSWAFREQPKFFDVVTWTGNGDNYRNISHNLKSTPGCVIVKSTSASGAWAVWHRSTDPNNLILNSSSAAISGQYSIQDVTSSNFGVANSSFYGFPQSIPVNDNGATYVAYLFAHNAGGFGTSGSDNVITCGSYTGNGSTSGPTVTLGYEPQWLMIKTSTTTGSWQMIDNMRGMVVGGNEARLLANSTSAELSNDYLSPTATGFQLVSTSSEVNGNGQTYIYIAIRRGPMKTPTTGTSVFAVNLAPDTSTPPLTWNTNSTVDSVLTKRNLSNTNGNNIFVDRPRGNSATLTTNNTSAESTNANITDLTISNGYIQKLVSTGGSGSAVTYAFSRAPGFFDVVCYTGTGASSQTYSHNLGVVPELMIVKSRNTSVTDWAVYNSTIGATNYLWLNTTDQSQAFSTIWNNTSPTSSIFTVGSNGQTGGNGSTYVAYLFATVAGVSKVGSYTGTGALQTVNCGFTTGARFILIKRTDSTGDWYVWDSARGISSGNDPYILLNNTAAEVTGTNYVDTTSVGFQVTAAAPAGLNANGGTYIFLAIA